MLIDNFYKRLINPVTPALNYCTFASVSRRGFEHVSGKSKSLNVDVLTSCANPAIFICDFFHFLDFTRVFLFYLLDIFNINICFL